MSTVILTTVGTSLLLNARREARVSDEEVLAYLERDPHAASAETNSLLGIWQQGDEVVLLHSDTEEGARAANLVRRYWLRKGPCGVVRIEGLAYEAQGFVDYGLKHFVQTLAGEIRKAARAQKEVVINATGGFKAEIAYATALGLIFKVPVCYIHERFREVVTLPPSPFGWDSGILLREEAFFDWVDAEPRPKTEVESRMRGLVYELEVRLLLEDTPDGYAMLSPLGQAYLEAFRLELEQSQAIPVYLSKKARRSWEGFDPSTQSRYRHLLERLRLPGRLGQSERKSGGGDALGYPKGPTSERLFYAEVGGALYVFELTQHGREYEVFCSSGLWWRDYPKDSFEPWKD